MASSYRLPEYCTFNISLSNVKLLLTEKYRQNKSALEIKFFFHIFMSSLCGVAVRIRVRVNNFSKTTRPRDMLFFFKDTLSIEDENLFKACKSVCSSVCYSHYKGCTPTKSVKISTLYHNFLSDYCRDFSHILHICTRPEVDSLV